MARVEVTKRWFSDDGKSFESKQAAEAYELREGLKPLTKMTQENLEAIMRGEDESRASLMRKVLGAISKPEGTKIKRPRRSAEERAADLKAKLAKITEKLGGSGEDEGEDSGEDSVYQAGNGSVHAPL